jgi:hypothetical protein
MSINDYIEIVLVMSLSFMIVFSIYTDLFKLSVQKGIIMTTVLFSGLGTFAFNLVMGTWYSLLILMIYWIIIIIGFYSFFRKDQSKM